MCVILGLLGRWNDRGWEGEEEEVGGGWWVGGWG